uniref:Uncharacterized protein n=1 Tax=Pipistrellus kuhlii TaxID=59472 RepID=A0A7J8B1X4_PIPKU|nr:hypothetical protein mPipKuh1_007725 [Pipistrellus kuhlii]
MGQWLGSDQLHCTCLGWPGTSGCHSVVLNGCPNGHPDDCPDGHSSVWPFGQFANYAFYFLLYSRGPMHEIDARVGLHSSGCLGLRSPGFVWKVVWMVVLLFGHLVNLHIMLLLLYHRCALFACHQGIDFFFFLENVMMGFHCSYASFPSKEHLFHI